MLKKVKNVKENTINMKWKSDKDVEKCGKCQRKYDKVDCERLKKLKPFLSATKKYIENKLFLTEPLNVDLSFVPPPKQNRILSHTNFSKNKNGFFLYKILVPRQ